MTIPSFPALPTIGRSLPFAHTLHSPRKSWKLVETFMKFLTGNIKKYKYREIYKHAKAKVGL